MSTITEVETTPQAIEDLAGRLFSEGVGAFHLGTVYIGLKHGLFDALVADGPLTAAELANRTGLDGWYVREWLQAETTAGLLLADDDDLSRARFTAAPGVREALVDETGPAYLGGLPLALPAAFSVMPELLAAFRTGAGVPYASYGEDAVEAQAALNRPAFVNQLVSEWIPQIPDVAALLEDSRSRDSRRRCGLRRRLGRDRARQGVPAPPRRRVRQRRGVDHPGPPQRRRRRGVGPGHLRCRRRLQRVWRRAATTWSCSSSACTTWPTRSPRLRRPRQPSPTAEP